MLLMSHLWRCTSPPGEFDSKEFVRRSREHTEVLVEELELGVLWETYGLVGDLVVSQIRVISSVLI